MLLNIKNMNISSDHEVDAMIRSLATEFPLHSAGELQRTICEAEDDLWPHKDPIDVVDRARVRLHQGLAG